MLLHFYHLFVILFLHRRALARSILSKKCISAFLLRIIL
ncbi:hypothetical protein HMPREF1514_0810 [Streptococcus sp. AS20]|nr:hypothetical protein HMPREF1109_0369 [Streptococcus intermedius SK54 = ATCC 27335]EUB25167.1 hypothetical protein HMPREF1514_0810 [Streptococcus sp. AS20]